jgi:hypothetical protein
MRKLTQDEYDEKVREKWGKTLEVMTPYTNARTLMRVRCTQCENNTPWLIEAGELIKIKRVCPHKLYKNKPMDERGYKEKVKDIQNGRVEVVTPYIDARTKVGHRCNPCICNKNLSVWFTLPQIVLSGKGCPYRAYAEKRKRIIDEYDSIALKFGFIRIGIFVDVHTKIQYECLDCGHVEDRVPRAFKNTTNSPRYCSACFALEKPRSFSKMAIRWIENISKDKGIYIQHAQNGGEYVIPGTNFSADGFCKSNNTVYEFYGDCFHGNPKRFNPDVVCSPYSKLTAAELYAKTKNRERVIKSKGYKLVTIWESDFKGIK